VCAVAIVTVTTVLCVEWGRRGEIGDLYVLPEARGQGMGRALIAAGVEQCRTCGCSAVSVTIMREGERPRARALLCEVQLRGDWTHDRERGAVLKGNSLQHNCCEWFSVPA
jgi:GNAT superfamily N-acetyltransferase